MKKVYGWTIAVILLGFVLAGVFLTMAPDTVPAHYNLYGEVDRWGSKYEFLIMPFFNLFFGAFMAGVGAFEHKQGRAMNAKIVGIMNVCILILFNVIWTVFMWNAVDPENMTGNLGDLATRLTMLVLMGSFIPLGNLLPKTQRNATLGLRTKWSMANDHCWQQSQRIGGYIMVGTGIVGVILTAVLPVNWACFVLIALIFAMTAACVWASYRVYMKSQIQ